MKKMEYDRVRCSTAHKDNLAIDRKILDNLKNYQNQSKEEISKRIAKIEKEWSIERWIELHASSLAFIGVLLGAFVNIYWLFLPGFVLFFLAIHAIQGWCPPIPIMRKLNIRTRREIDWEKFALKAMRHDFGTDISSKSPEDILDKVRK